MLEQFLAADSSDKLLEIERFEVRNVFEPFFFELLLGRMQHCACLWTALDKMCIVVCENVLALERSVSDEQDRTGILQVCETVCPDDLRLGFAELIAFRSEN